MKELRLGPWSEQALLFLSFFLSYFLLLTFLFCRMAPHAPVHNSYNNSLGVILLHNIILQAADDHLGVGHDNAVGCTLDLGDTDPGNQLLNDIDRSARDDSIFFALLYKKSMLH